MISDRSRHALRLEKRACLCAFVPGDAWFPARRLLARIERARARARNDSAFRDRNRRPGGSRSPSSRAAVDASRGVDSRCHDGEEPSLEDAVFSPAEVSWTVRPELYQGKKEDFHVIPLTYFDGEKKKFSSTNQLLEQFYSGKAERDRVKQQAKDLYRFIQNEQDKNKRKLKKHERTLQKAENADKYQKLGELLTANMHLVNL